jgi:hypothetical protein
MSLGGRFERDGDAMLVTLLVDKTTYGPFYIVSTLPVPPQPDIRRTDFRIKLQISGVGRASWMPEAHGFYRRLAVIPAAPHHRKIQRRPTFQFTYKLIPNVTPVDFGKC